jgi:hypothetical protein
MTRSAEAEAKRITSLRRTLARKRLGVTPRSSGLKKTLADSIERLTAILERSTDPNLVLRLTRQQMSALDLLHRL